MITPLARIALVLSTATTFSLIAFPAAACDVGCMPRGVALIHAPAVQAATVELQQPALSWVFRRSTFTNDPITGAGRPIRPQGAGRAVGRSTAGHQQLPPDALRAAWPQRVDGYDLCRARLGHRRRRARRPVADVQRCLERGDPQRQLLQLAAVDRTLAAAGLLRSQLGRWPGVGRPRRLARRRPELGRRKRRLESEPWLARRRLESGRTVRTAAPTRRSQVGKATVAAHKAGQAGRCRTKVGPRPPHGASFSSTCSPRPASGRRIGRR